jgi:hypothetical protein
MVLLIVNYTEDYEQVQMGKRLIFDLILWLVRNW